MVYLARLWNIILTILFFNWKGFTNSVEKKNTIGLSRNDSSKKSYSDLIILEKQHNEYIPTIQSTNSTTTIIEGKSSAGMVQYLPGFLQFQFHKKKLVLDLDETLISSSHRHSNRHDHAVKVYIGGVPTTFYIRKRPHVDLFLETVSQWFELVIFTASLSSYANAVIDRLDPKRRINRRFYRQSCNNQYGSYIKDLKIVCKDLSKVVIIDNSPVAYSCNKENAIPIDDWIGNNCQDKSLLDLIPLLEQVRDSEDVRKVLKSYPKAPCYDANIYTRVGS